MENELIEPAPSSVKLPKLAVIAAVVAFLLVLAAIAGAFQHVWNLIGAVVPAIAGVTILRKRAWGAYGFALFELVQSTVAPALLFGNSGIRAAQIAVLVVFGLALALLFFFAGRSLTKAGAPSGWRLPWVAVTVLFSAPLLFVRAFVVPTGSMENTLLIGDHVLVRVFPKAVPGRGDVVVFRYPPDRKQIQIKRILGVPGDRVRMVARTVYVNGTMLREPYVIRRFPYDSVRDNLPGDSSTPEFMIAAVNASGREEMLKNHVTNGEIVIPPNKYFVLGDNRDNSLDSRYWGFVDASDIIGKPFIIYDSEVTGDASAAGGSRGRVRWERVFKFL